MPKPYVAKQIQEGLPRSAEVVTCIGASHYFQDLAGALRRLQELLGPRGRILVRERAKDDSVLPVGRNMVHGGLLRDGIRFYQSEERGRPSRALRPLHTSQRSALPDVGPSGLSLSPVPAFADLCNDL